MGMIFLWVVFTIAVAILADRRGRSFVIWFFVALIVSPLLAGIFVLCLTNIKAEKEAERRHQEMLEATRQAK